MDKGHTPDADLGLTEQDVADLASLDEELPKKNTLLAVWRNVLGNAESSLANKIPAKVALKIVTAWKDLRFADLPAYHERYHEMLIAQRNILDEIIASDSEALKRTKDDAVDNRALYLELMFQWQYQGLLWEEAWDCTAPDAAIELAALEDAMGFFFGPQGLIQHLSAIGFSYSEQDAEALGERLTAAKEAL